MHDSQEKRMQLRIATSRPKDKGRKHRQTHRYIWVLLTPSCTPKAMGGENSIEEM
jgi:hypothetical protein